MTTRGTAAWRSPIRPHAVSPPPVGCDCLLSGNLQYMLGPRTHLAERAARKMGAPTACHHETFM